MPYIERLDHWVRPINRWKQRCKRPCLINFSRSPRRPSGSSSKENNADPGQIGDYISALFNAAALYGVRFGYVIWGINDGSWQIVGTNLTPQLQYRQ